MSFMNVLRLFLFLIVLLIYTSCISTDVITVDIMDDIQLQPGEPGPVKDDKLSMYLKPGETYSILPEDGNQFWPRIMTREIAIKYQAVNGRTKCTTFVADMINNFFGEKVYKSIFPNGVKGANTTFVDWSGNSSLIRLGSEDFTINDIQELADQNYLILMAYYYPKVAGHVAFVGTRGLIMFTIPPLDRLEGKDSQTLKESWLPVMVQAGTYTGVTSMVYATNGWLRNDNFEDGYVRYYLVKVSR